MWMHDFFLSEAFFHAQDIGYEPWSVLTFPLLVPCGRTPAISRAGAGFFLNLRRYGTARGVGASSTQQADFIPANVERKLFFAGL